MSKFSFVVCAVAGLLLSQLSFGAVDVAKAKKLATKKMCLACHAIDKKLVGPAYKAVAKKYNEEDEKYKNDKGAAVKMLSNKIRKGGSGNWGAIPMPPNPMSEDEAKLLVEWILSM